jgi:hypothetical protein
MTCVQELRRLQREAQEKDQENKRLREENASLKSSQKKRHKKRRRVDNKTPEEIALHKAGQLYALTKRLWLPNLDGDLGEISTDDLSAEVCEYINALPEDTREEWQDLAVISVVSNYNPRHPDANFTSV